MPFVPASAMNFDRQATKKGQPLYEDLKQKVRSLATAHADETYLRQDGINHFLWYGGSKKLALFLIARHRSGKVAQSIFGDDFDGVLHTDGYAGYNAVNAKRRQTCLVHLIRKSKEIKQEVLLRKPSYQDKKLIRFCNRIGKLFKKACQLAAKFSNDHICQLKADAFQHRLYCALHTVCSAKLAD